ncbi:MAG: alpha/beta hydrolase [Alphaproteobacteria bacterium]|nr:alpha/beta hydrolase [Alphaproteobacteria bacterium]
MFEGFSDKRIEVSDGLSLRARLAGSGPPVLLLHGYPQTHHCWHKVAPQLVQAGYTVVLSDLRGYGDSDKPVSSANHETYSKRAMAADQAALMARLGFSRFSVAGHDRGGRVAHRLGLDYPEAVERMAVLDIAPTATMYERTNKEFATGYYHWFFLIQPAPLPERLIGADPSFYLLSKLAAWSKGNTAAFSEAAVAEYIRCFSDAACIAATCEDYRAAASIDLAHDAEDKDKRLEMPLLALWGAKGLVGKLYDVLETWREKAAHVEGAALACGHYLPEEVPDETAAALIRFFRGG